MVEMAVGSGETVARAERRDQEEMEGMVAPAAKVETAVLEARMGLVEMAEMVELVQTAEMAAMVGPRLPEAVAKAATLETAGMVPAVHQAMVVLAGQARARTMVEREVMAVLAAAETMEVLADRADPVVPRAAMVEREEMEEARVPVRMTAVVAAV